jgi:hypothetical protein
MEREIEKGWVDRRRHSGIEREIKGVIEEYFFYSTLLIERYSYNFFNQG